MINICNAIDHVEGDDKIPNEVKYKVYNHRAGIQLMVKNWGYAISDLSSALNYIDSEEIIVKIVDCYINLENFEKAKEIINQRSKVNVIFK